jgi:hypothetical protein
MAIDAGALVEPAVAEGGVDARGDVVFGAVVEKVGEVEAEGRIAVVVAADEASIDEDENIAEGSIKLNPDAAARVRSGDVEPAPVPAYAGIRVAPAERLVAMAFLCIVVDKWQLHGPIVWQVE